MAFTNSDIVPAAIRGIDRENGRGSFHTRREDSETSFYGFGWHQGYGSWYGKDKDVRDEFAKLYRAGYRVRQSIYSYATPVALLIESTKTGERCWVQWDRSYSATTGSKHVSQLWKLSTWGRSEYMPYDATAEDIIGIVEGYTRYIRGTKRFEPGRFVAGLVRREAGAR